MPFQTLTLMATPSVYKEKTTYSDGSYDRGIWSDGIVSISYEKIDGFIEPYVRSQSALILPSGVKSDESLYLYTNSPINIHNDLPSNQHLGDTIFIEDPQVNPNAVPYLAYDKEPWKTNTNFTLITQNFNKIILVRKEKF